MNLLLRQSAHGARTLGLCFALTCIFSAPANAAFKEFRGNYVPGYYGNELSRIVYFSVVVTGPFNHQNAGQSFGQALAIVKQNAAQGKILTHNLTRISHHTSNEYFVICGWCNLDDNNWGWMAMENTSPTTTEFLRNDGTGGTSNGWVNSNWQNAGYRIHIQGADDDHGNVAFEMNAPN